MGLVEYSSSSESDRDPNDDRTSRQLDDNNITIDTAKSAAVQTRAGAPPALPPTFNDLYSANVRTSTHDDPSLHGGRRRVIPHTIGNWPTHVYLEWRPNAAALSVLSDLISRCESLPFTHYIDHEQHHHDRRHRQNNIHLPAQNDRYANRTTRIHRSFQNELGVLLPLHVSLSRTLMLKEMQRQDFVASLQKVISRSTVCPFDARVCDIRWCSNEVNTRWFLVLQLESSEKGELTRILNLCNAVAKDFDQPLLYDGSVDGAFTSGESTVETFHISIGWTTVEQKDVTPLVEIAQLNDLVIDFSEVKIRSGQNVTSIRLNTARTKP